MEIDQKLERIRHIFIGVPIIRSNEYPYSFFSLTDFIPPLHPRLVEDMADLIVNYSDFLENADIIVSEADRGGGPLTHAVAARANLPYSLANWYPKGIAGEIFVRASVGFSGEGNVFLNGLSAGQRVVLVDDLLSTGGTALALLTAVKKSGAIPIEALFVGEKIDQGGRRTIANSYNIPVKSIVQFIARGKHTRAP